MSRTVQRPHIVYFFGTFLVDLIYPQAGMAAFDLLQREGVKVLYPQDRTCCYQPAFNSGYREQASAVAAHQLRLLAEDYPVVVPSGSCAGMIKHHYPELLRGDSVLRGGHTASRPGLRTDRVPGRSLRYPAAASGAASPHRSA